MKTAKQVAESVGNVSVDSACEIHTRFVSGDIEIRLFGFSCGMIYKVLWRPEEIEVEFAAQVVPILREGLCKLVSDPAYYKQLDSPNGWGLYEHFVPFCIEVLEACQANPDALVEVSR